MSVLLDTPSSGLSEVIETLHYLGASWSGIQLHRVGPLVSRRYGGDENREGSDDAWEADVLTILGQLQDAGYVIGHDDSGETVDLKSSPPDTTWVALTASGREYARHPRPRPRRARYGD